MFYRKCEICGLRSRNKDGKKLFLMARFPLDEIRCKEWVRVTGQEDLAYIPIERLHAIKTVCEKHFDEKDFTNKKTRLQNTAVPSIGLTAKPLSDDILKDFPCHVYKEGSLSAANLTPSEEEALQDDIAQEAITDVETPVASEDQIEVGEECTIDIDEGDHQASNVQYDDHHVGDDLSADDEDGQPAPSTGPPSPRYVEKLPTASKTTKPSPPRFVAKPSTALKTMMLPPTRITARVLSANTLTRMPPPQFVGRVPTGKFVTKPSNARFIKLPTATYIKLPTDITETQPMDSISLETEPATIQIEIKPDDKGTFEKQYGHCRCCLKTGEHCIADVEGLLECLNVQPSSDLRVTPLVCYDCSKFLQQAKMFRDMVAASERTLLAVIHTLDDDNDNVEEKTPSMKVEYVSKPVKDEDTANVDTEEATNEVMADDGPTLEERPFSQFSDYTDISMDNRETLTDEDINQLVTSMRKEQAKWSSFIRENLIMLLECSTITPFASIKGLNFDCIYCDGTYPHINGLRQHMEEKHIDEDSNFKHEILKIIPQTILRADISCMKCRLCGEQFTTVDNLVEHLVNVHNRKYHNITTDPPHKIICFDLSLDEWKCLECEKIFPTFRKLRAHVNQHFGSFLCHLCGSKFLYHNAYSHHMQSHKKVEVAKHMCDTCGATFRIGKELLKHKNWVHGDTTTKRKMNPPSAVAEKKIKVPLIPPQETPGAIYECILCENYTTFTSKYSAYMHRIGHLNNTRDGPFACEQCQYVTSKKINLKYHIQVHYDVKKFMCEICNKTYLKKSKLTEHMNTHLNLRFKCPLCDTTLSNKKHVKRHVQKLHPNVTVEF